MYLKKEESIVQDLGLMKKGKELFWEEKNE